MGIVSYVGAHGESAEGRRKRSAGQLATSFFLGIVLSLLAMGTAAAVFGRLLARWSTAFVAATAALSILAGVAALLGPALRRHVHNPEVSRRGGMSGAFVYGLLYTVATLTTSAGPLMLLLTVAAAIGRPFYGAMLSLMYGVGRGLPFLIAGLSAGRLAGWMAPLERGRRVTEVVSGLALVGVGAYFLTLTF